MFQTLAMNDSFIKANSMISSIGIIFQVGSFLLATITFSISYMPIHFTVIKTKRVRYVYDVRCEKYKITLLMFMETLAIGITSLIIGIGIGIGLSKGMDNFS